MRPRRGCALQQPVHRWERGDDINIFHSACSSFLGGGAGSSFSLFLCYNLQLQAEKPLHGDRLTSHMCVFAVYLQALGWEVVIWPPQWPALSSQSPGQPIDRLSVTSHVGWALTPNTCSRAPHACRGAPHLFYMCVTGWLWMCVRGCLGWCICFLFSFSIWILYFMRILFLYSSVQRWDKEIAVISILIRY